MEPTADELAGVADLFGGLDRNEVHEAFRNVAARTGAEFDDEALDDAIDGALRDYYLVEVDGFLAPGPAALPALPDHGVDLPHMMAVEDRDLGRPALAEAAAARLRDEADRAVAAGDDARARDLLDVCYDMTAWASVDLEGVRDRLDELVATEP